MGENKKPRLINERRGKQWAGETPFGQWKRTVIRRHCARGTTDGLSNLEGIPRRPVIDAGGSNLPIREDPVEGGETGAKEK